MVTVFLTDIDAEQFKLFQKNYALFKHMNDTGVFKVGFGKVIFNIAYGEIQNVVKEEVVYKQ